MQVDRDAANRGLAWLLTAMVIGGLVVLSLAESGYKPEWAKEAEANGRANNAITAHGAGPWEGVFRKFDRRRVQ